MGPFQILMGVVLILGAVLCWIPQYMSIIKARSSDGLSYWTLLLTNTSNIAAVVNIVLLNYQNLADCANKGVVEDPCLPALFSISQIVFLFLAYFPLFILFLVYFNRVASDLRLKREWITALCALCVLAVFATVCAFVAAWLVRHYGWSGKQTAAYAYSLGTLSAFSTMVQWTPQIVSTFMTKTRGCISIVTLCISAPGAILSVVFMVFVSHQSITTWGCFLFSAIQQILLIVLLLRCPAPPAERRDSEEQLLKMHDIVVPLSGPEEPLLEEMQEMDVPLSPSKARQLGQHLEANPNAHSLNSQGTELKLLAPV
eukprot:gnl/Hemi2/21966_TR7337_c0_g1_i1.p1 gnl/Hemi2/21966_TR7337_c0_g1~~gnl/Hemi2/21966_TR7337_c0_g1_i1.p1  ORF type:complete len:314 (-),score=71.49 gnl/Hemi2/21966_TR7337_c0_g1_i1:258-1199(-)